MAVKEDVTILKIRGTKDYIVVPLSLETPNDEKLIEPHQLSTYMVDLLKGVDSSKYLIEYSCAIKEVSVRDVYAITYIIIVTKVRIKYMNDGASILETIYHIDKPTNEYVKVHFTDGAWVVTLVELTTNTKETHTRTMVKTLEEAKKIVEVWVTEHRTDAVMFNLTKVLITEELKTFYNELSNSLPVIIEAMNSKTVIVKGCVARKTGIEVENPLEGLTEKNMLKPDVDVFFTDLPKHTEEQLEELLSGAKGTNSVDCYPTSRLTIGAGKSRTSKLSSVFFLIKQDGEKIVIGMYERLKEESKPIQALCVERNMFKKTLSDLITVNRPYEIEVVGSGRFELYSLISDIDSLVKGTDISVSIRARSSLVKEKTFTMRMCFPSHEKMHITKDTTALKLINKPVLISGTVIKGKTLKLYSCVLNSEGKEVKTYVVFYDIDVLATIEDGVKYFNFDNIKPLNAVALTNSIDDACKAYSDQIAKSLIKFNGVVLNKVN